MTIRIIRQVKLNHEIYLLLEVKDNDVPQRSFLHSFITLVRTVILSAIRFYSVISEIRNHSSPSSFSATAIC
jgi:hypothetical protein